MTESLRRNGGGVFPVPVEGAPGNMHVELLAACYGRGVAAEAVCK